MFVHFIDSSKDLNNILFKIISYMKYNFVEYADNRNK